MRITRMWVPPACSNPKNARQAVYNQALATLDDTTVQLWQSKKNGGGVALHRLDPQPRTSPREAHNRCDRGSTKKPPAVQGVSSARPGELAPVAWTGPILLICRYPNSVHRCPPASTHAEMAGFRFHSSPRPSTRIHSVWLPTWLPAHRLAIRETVPLLTPDSPFAWPASGTRFQLSKNY